MSPAAPPSLGRRRIAVGAATGTLALVLSAASDFVVRSFWSAHALLTSLAANVLVVLISVAVINELIDSRRRNQWHLLAQAVLFDLAGNARLVWTDLGELLQLIDGRSGTPETVHTDAQVARDTQQVSAATAQLLADQERRQRLQTVLRQLEAHSSDILARWTPIMVGATPYTRLFDRHVELFARLRWVASVLAHNEPLPDRDERHRRLDRATVAAQNAERFDDTWLGDMIVSITLLAAQLDFESLELAFSLAPPDWWARRTHALKT